MGNAPVGEVLGEKVLHARRDNGVRSACRRKGGQGGIPRCKMLGGAVVGEVLVGGKVVPRADQGVRCREKQRWVKCL